MTEPFVHYDGHDWLVIADVDGWLGLRREHVRTWAPETACREAGEKPGIKLRFEWRVTGCFIVGINKIIGEAYKLRTGTWIGSPETQDDDHAFPTESEARAYVEATVTEAIKGAMEPVVSPPRESAG